VTEKSLGMINAKISLITQVASWLLWPQTQTKSWWHYCLLAIWCGLHRLNYQVVKH